MARLRQRSSRRNWVNQRSKVVQAGRVLSEIILGLDMSSKSNRLRNN